MKVIQQNSEAVVWGCRIDFTTPEKVFSGTRNLYARFVFEFRIRKYAAISMSRCIAKNLRFH